MATVQLPMTMEALVGGLETEPGSEPHFCPVKALPIKRTHRVRTLPGFHLLCLDAGKEAMARGSYEAFGQRFHCESLEYLHQDDKVFICPQDQKAFLNQMSMRYHQYIRHELQERKEERKRLRERAEESGRGKLELIGIDSNPTACQQGLFEIEPAEGHQRDGNQKLRTRTLWLDGQLRKHGMVEWQNDVFRLVASQYEHQGMQAAGEEQEEKARQPEHDNEVLSKEEKMLLPLKLGWLRQAAWVASRKPGKIAVRTGLERPSLASDVPETPPPVINEDFPEVKLPKPRNEADPRLASTLTPLPVQTPMTPAPSTQKPPVDDDLYGDLGGEQAKRQKTGSAYASAMTAMMTGDFDDDDCPQAPRPFVHFTFPGDEIPCTMLLKLFAAFATAHVAAASDASLEDAALSLIQGHARKIVKTKGSKLATQLSATDALADFEGGAGLSLIQGNQCRLNVDEHCAAPAGARRVKKAADPALSAAVADGIEDGVAALSLFQVTRGSWRKGDECHGSVRDVVADEATTDQAADSAATSLIQQERSKIKVRRASVEGS
ncbi:unnamed protein product [Symbiodinium sp. KB8]|nr:unnamed protein product [Symbiodinium sp. KB8]